MRLVIAVIVYSAGRLFFLFGGVVSLGIQKSNLYHDRGWEHMKLNGTIVTIENFDTVPNGSLKPILWSQSVYDTQVISSTALQVPDGASFIKLFFQVKWDWDNMTEKSTGFRIAQVRKNGTDDSQLPESRIAAAPKTYTTQNGSTPAIQVNAGDIFELWVGQDSGFDIKIFPHQTWFAMEIVEATTPILAGITIRD